jgi:hypothetical protein
VTSRTNLSSTIHEQPYGHAPTGQEPKRKNKNNRQTNKQTKKMESTTNIIDQGTTTDYSFVEVTIVKDESNNKVVLNMEEISASNVDNENSRSSSTQSCASETSSPSMECPITASKRRALLRRKASVKGGEVWVASNPYVEDVLQPLEQEEKENLDNNQSYVASKIHVVGYKDGSFYEGELKGDSLKHGKGNIQYVNGDMYDGEFADDMRHGSGTCRFFSSDILAYTGHWQHDKPVEGKEAMVLYRNGDRYFGQVKADNSRAKNSVWHSEAHQATNENIYDLDSSIRIGSVPSYLPHIQKHGRGEIYLHTGDKYYGNFLNDQMSGYGVMVFRNNDEIQEKQYYGNWKDNMQEGFGVMIYKDGTLYEGEWKQGNRNGKGVLSLPNGDRIEGYWKHGDIKKASYKKGTIKNSSRCSKILLRESVQELEKIGYSANLHFSHINSSTIPDSDLMTQKKYKDFLKVYVPAIKAEQKRFARSSTNQFIEHRRKQINGNSEPLSPMSRKSIQDAIQTYLDESLFSKFVQSHYHEESIDETDQYMNDMYNSNILFRITQDFVHLFGWRYHHSFITSPIDAKFQLPNALDDLFSFFNELKSVVADVLGIDAVAIYGSNKLMYTIKNCVTRRVYNTLFNIYKICYEEQDVLFRFKLLSLSKISMFELGVHPDFMLEEQNNQLLKRPYNDAIVKLRQLSANCFTAHDKYAQLVETHQEIINTIDYNIMSKKKMNPNIKQQMDIGADDLFPVYLYVFIRAQLPNLYSEYMFMNDFMDEYVRTTEASYRFTTFENAMNFVQSLDVNIRDEKGILVPISHLESRVERSILDIFAQIKREKKEMPRFLWMSSLFIVIGNYVSNETHNHIQNSLENTGESQNTAFKGRNRKLLIDGDHHHVRMLVNYFDYAKAILKCVGIELSIVSQSQKQQQEEEHKSDTTSTTSTNENIREEKPTFIEHKIPSRLSSKKYSSPESPSNSLPSFGNQNDAIPNPSIELAFVRMYPSYVYFSLAKNVEKVTDNYLS